MSFNAQQSFRVKYTTGACLVSKKGQMSTGQTALENNINCSLGLLEWILLYFNISYREISETPCVLRDCL